MTTQPSIFFTQLRQQAAALLKQGLNTNSDAHNLFIKAGPLQLDLSRQVINASILTNCLEQAKKTGLAQSIQGLFNGAIVNPTEERQALHSLLRSTTPRPGLAEEHALIQTTLSDMAHFANAVINASYKLSGDANVSDVVNLGVGGSDLGPRLAYNALKHSHNHLKVHFVANIDGNDLKDTLAHLNPKTTLFIVTSKTFSTLETLENTKAAIAWLTDAGVTSPGLHLAAATARPDRAADFDIDARRVFPMWDWVGGRYSLLSSVGLALMLGIGPTAFNAIRQGALSIDQHVESTPLEENAAFLQGIAGLVSNNGLDIHNHAVIAYDSRLELLPAYLQQLEMESNGKSVNLSGQGFDYATCPVLWGGVGTNTQHSFHQLLHQGTLQANIDFLMPMAQDHGLAQHQAYLQANCLAQVEGLLHGKDLATVKAELQAQGMSTAAIDQLAPHKVIQGNKPCTIIGYHTLNPAVLGALIALYEHKVFIQAHFWQINPFDQWGVELGKQLCEPVYQAIIDPTATAKDTRTQRWVDLIREQEAPG